MKSNVSIMFLFMFCSIVSAQTQRGKFLIEGGTNLNTSLMNYTYDYGSSTSNKYNASQFYIQTEIGFFVVNNLCIGESTGFIYSDSKNKTSNDESKGTTLQIGPFVRYYIGKSKIKPLVQTQFQWTTSNDKYTSSGSTTDNKSSGIGFGGGIGAGFFVNDNVGFNGILSYGTNTKKYKNTDNKQTTSGLSFTISLSICL
jgi:outer membrane protein